MSERKSSVSSNNSIVVPDNIRDFLVIEDCSNFPLDRYVLTKNEAQIAQDINNARKIAPQMKEMNIAYLNSTLLYGPPGTGKAQPLSAKVLTPDGFVKMGDIEKGTMVMTPSGSKAEVISIYPQGVMDVYEVTFDDGGCTRCTKDHLWEIRDPEGITKVMTLDDLLKKMKKNEKQDGYSVRNIKAVDFEEREFTIPPAEYGKALAQDIVAPADDYLMGSKMQRLAFFNAFMQESEARKIMKGKKEYLHFKSEEGELSGFITNMIRSLGLKCIREAGDGMDLRITRGDDRRYIKSIELIGQEECQCIYISDPEHLYITDDYIATHNTTFGRYMAYKLKMPFAFIQFANIMSGSMGETSRNITRIFDFIKEQRCIFMMDEIDAISARRGDTIDKGTGGELGRITITVMQELDKLKRNNSPLIIIAASNVIKGIDDALRSRFAIKKEMVRWTNEEKEMYVKKYLDSIGIEHSDEMVHKYITQNSSQDQRGIEADINRCIADWLLGGKKEFKLNHIREMEVK